MLAVKHVKSGVVNNKIEQVDSFLARTNNHDDWIQRERANYWKRLACDNAFSIKNRRFSGTSRTWKGQKSHPSRKTSILSSVSPKTVPSKEVPSVFVPTPKFCGAPTWIIQLLSIQVQHIPHKSHKAQFFWRLKCAVLIGGDKTPPTSLEGQFFVLTSTNENNYCIWWWDQKDQSHGKLIHEWVQWRGLCSHYWEIAWTVFVLLQNRSLEHLYW